MEIIKKIKANFVQIVEILMLIIAIFLPYKLDIPSWFVAYLRDHKPEPEISDFLPYYILKNWQYGDFIGFIICCSYSNPQIQQRIYNE